MITNSEIKRYPDEICRELLKAVNILIAEGATKIILFGSLAKNNFKHYSDIDLACEGIKDERFFPAYGKFLFNLKIPSDLVDIDDIDDFFASRIREDGIVLYEK